MTPEDRSRTLEIGQGEPPEPGRYRELPEGILWIRLPIPGALRHINVWLVPGRRGWFLVDTGMKTREVEQAWRDLATRLPLSSALDGIVVTHHHPDHFGMAQWLSDQHGVGVAMHPRSATAAAAALADPEEVPGYPSDGFVERLGIELDEAMRAILRGGIYRTIVSGQPHTTPLRPEVALAGNERAWRVTVHDGHAPGHSCLYDGTSRILISGDQVLPTISSNISLYPSNEHGDPLGDYFASLDELASLPEDTLVLPAHGRPFMTLHARIRALRTEHAKRLDQVVSRCIEPSSTTTVASALFRLDRLDTLNRLLATTETLAHLRHLELAGKLARAGRGRELRWLAG
jgi:glyoxylase-like metal-dependent hydrolase (beta-lactamase superfamily II)